MLSGVSRAFLKLSLAAKLTVLATVTTALSTTILCAVLGSYEASRMRERLLSEAQSVVEMIGWSATAPLIFDDPKTATETVAAVGPDARITTVAILKPGGQILGRFDRNRHEGGVPPPLALVGDVLQTPQQYSAFVGRRLIMTSPIRLNGEVLGSAYVELDLSELHETMVRLWTTFVLALVGTVLLGGLIAWRLQRLVSAPILRLTETARAVSRNGNFALRATKESDDEIGELVSGFNEMLDVIQRRDATLDVHRQELEQTVDVRTAELKASVERYRMLVENTQVVPWEVDGASLAFRYISPQAQRLFGHRQEVIISRMSMRDLIHADDRDRVMQRLELIVASGGHELDVDHRVITADSRVVDVRSVMTVDRSAPARGVVLRGFTVDVTRQKKLEMELRQAQKLESVGRLAAGVAHEINTPVQFVSDSVHFVRDAVLDLTALIQQYGIFRQAVAAGRDGPADIERLVALTESTDLDYLLENVPKALDRSLEGLDRVRTIVRSMKEFAHPDETMMAPVDINQAIRSTLTIARNEYKYVADLDLALGELPLVTCHGGDVNQVILNIIINAAHAIQDRVGQTGQRGRIGVATLRDGGFAIIRIADTGGGIPYQIRERIFDPFFTTKTVGRGTGQGLAIARAVVMEKHAGDLSFETETGQGTTFVIRLPINGRSESGVAA